MKICTVKIPNLDGSDVILTDVIRREIRYKLAIAGRSQGSEVSVVRVWLDCRRCTSFRVAVAERDLDQFRAAVREICRELEMSSVHLEISGTVVEKLGWPFASPKMTFSPKVISEVNAKFSDIPGLRTGDNLPVATIGAAAEAALEAFLSSSRRSAEASLREQEDSADPDEIIEPYDLPTVCVDSSPYSIPSRGAEFGGELCKHDVARLKAAGYEVHVYCHKGVTATVVTRSR